MSLPNQAKTLSEKKQKEILHHLTITRNPTRNKLIFLLSFKAGLRAKEIANLTWAMIFTPDNKLSNKIMLTNNASKGQSSGREIPMHHKLNTAFDSYYKELTQKGIVININDRVIRMERSNKATPQIITNLFYTLYKKFKYSGCSSHSGRRTFITNAARKINSVGGSLNDIKLLAGHSSLSTTQRYIEYSTEAQKKIIDLI